MIQPSREMHIFPTPSGSCEIALYDILWAEGSTEGKKRPTLLHLADQVVSCTTPFETLRPLLGDTFLSCLSDGAVNELRIRSFEGDQIEIDTGEILKVPPFLAPKFREKFCRDLASWVWVD